MKKTIAFIGSAGVPNIYGGFEMFLESCTPGILKSFAKVFVTCDRSKYADRSRNWRGVTRVFVPVGANGASSVLHDLLAFFAVLWRADAIVVLGVSGGIFFPLFRLIASLMGKKLIVNVDGIEWRRAKFPVPSARSCTFPIGWLNCLLTKSSWTTRRCVRSWCARYKSPPP